MKPKCSTIRNEAQLQCIHSDTGTFSVGPIRTHSLSAYMAFKTYTTEAKGLSHGTLVYISGKAHQEPAGGIQFSKQGGKAFNYTPLALSNIELRIATRQCDQNSVSGVCQPVMFV